MDKNFIYKRKNYNAIATNSGLELIITCGLNGANLYIKKVKTKNEIIYDKKIDKYPNIAKLNMVENKFCLYLKGVPLTKLKNIMKIKNDYKYANVILDATELKRDFIEIPKIIELKKKREYEELQKKLDKKLKLNPVLNIEREFAYFSVEGEFSDSEKVLDIVDKIQSTFDCRIMNFDKFIVSEIKTDICFLEKYEIPYFELQKIEKIADKKLKERESKKEKKEQEKALKKDEHFKKNEKEGRRNRYPSAY